MESRGCAGGRCLSPCVPLADAADRRVVEAISDVLVGRRAADVRVVDASPHERPQLGSPDEGVADAAKLGRGLLEASVTGQRVARQAWHGCQLSLDYGY